MNEISIELKDLSIGYPQKGGIKTVAANLNAAVYSGRLTCLLGPNGVGKSTLLRTLSKFQPRIAGQILLLGHDIDSLTNQELSRTIGVVLTERPNIDNMTARQLVAMGRAPYTGFWGTLDQEDQCQVDEAMQLIGIENLSQRLINTLSDGERQKVMMAKVLAQQTPIILLDEPTAFLDFPSKVETMLMMKDIAMKTNKTIFLSTHDLELALQTADTLWLMGHDSALHTGTPQQLADNGALAQFVERPGIRLDTQHLTLIVDNTITQNY